MFHLRKRLSPRAFAFGDQRLRRWTMTSRRLDEVAAYAAF
jgi:hypothetical protein